MAICCSDLLFMHLQTTNLMRLKPCSERTRLTTGSKISLRTLQLQNGLRI